MLRLTDRAREALAAADAAARRFNPDARVRLRPGPGGVVADLVEGPEAGESVLELDGVAIVVDDALAGTVDAGEHQTLTLGP
jgi:plasmid stabilization system protein ParE